MKKDVVKIGKAFVVTCMLCMPGYMLAGDHSTSPNSYFLNTGDVANSLNLIPAPPAESRARYA